MDNERITFISNTCDDIKNKFLNLKQELNEDEKDGFRANILDSLQTVYDYLNECPDDEIKNKINDYLDSLNDLISNYFETNFLNVGLKNQIISSFDNINTFLKDYTTQLEAEENIVGAYQKKLEVYNSKLNEFNESYKLYTSGKISYEICAEKYNNLNKDYKDLNELYKKINDNTIEKPKRPRTVPKTIEDLKFKTLLEHIQDYQEHSNYYDLDVYDKFEEARKKFEANEISYEEYSKEALKCISVYFSVRSAYTELMKEFEEIEKSFDANGEYKIGTEEDLNSFYSNKEIYEKNIEKYQQEIEKLNELNDNFEKGLVSEEELELQQQKVNTLAETLQNQQKMLKKQRNKVYNASILTKLKDQQKILKNYLDVNELTEEQKDELKTKYEEITRKIKEIERYKNTLTIKQAIKKPRKQGTKNPSMRKPKINGPIEKPQDILVYGNEPHNNPEQNPGSEIIPYPGGPEQNPGSEIIPYPGGPEQNPGSEIIPYPGGPEPNPDSEIIPDPEYLDPTNVTTQSKGSYIDLDYIIDFLANGEELQHYKWYDNIIYNASKSRLINWHHTKERTFLDKPMKLVRTVIGAVVIGTGKILAKFLKINKNNADRVNGMIERVNQLSNEQLDFLIKNLTSTVEKDRFGAFPRAVREALQTRLESRVQEIVENTNLELQQRYNKLIDDYNDCTQLIYKLRDPQTQPEEIPNIQAQIDAYSPSFFSQINEINALYAEFDAKINKNGIAGMRDNLKFRKAGLTGGRNSSDKDHPLVRKLAGDIGHVMQQTDNGYEMASMFLYKEKVRIENTVQKRTAKNRGAKANVGAYEYSPYIEITDYTPYEYAKDVLLTVTTVMSIMSIANQMKQMQAYEQLSNDYNKLAGEYNNLVGDYQNVANAYQNLQSWVTTYQGKVNDLLVSLQNGGAEATKTMEDMLRTMPGAMHGSIEYAMMQADAAGTTSWLQSSGNIYSSMDSSLHNYTSQITTDNEALISSMQGQPVATRLQAYQTRLQEMADQYKTFLNPLQAGNQKYISTWTGFDEAAMTSLFNNVAQVNPAALNTVVTDIQNSANAILAMKNLPAEAIKAVHTIQASSGAAATDLVPAIATLAGLGILNGISPESRKLLTDTDNMREALIEKLESAHIDIHEQAKAAYDEAIEAWDRDGQYEILGQTLSQAPDMTEIERAYMEDYIKNNSNINIREGRYR